MVAVIAAVVVTSKDKENTEPVYRRNLIVHSKWLKL